MQFIINYVVVIEISNHQCNINMLLSFSKGNQHIFFDTRDIAGGALER